MPNNPPSGTRRDRVFKSFVESPSRGEKFTAQEVCIGNVDELASVIGGSGDQIDLADGSVSAIKAVYKTVLGVKVAQDGATYEESVVVGVSVNGASTGNQLTYKTIGRLRDSSLNFPINEIIYLGENGQLTNTPPVAGFRTVIGSSNGEGELQINIQEPIII